MGPVNLISIAFDTWIGVGWSCWVKYPGKCWSLSSVFSQEHTKMIAKWYVFQANNSSNEFCREINLVMIHWFLPSFFKARNFMAIHGHHPVYANSPGFLGFQNHFWRKIPTPSESKRPSNDIDFFCLSSIISWLSSLFLETLWPLLPQFWEFFAIFVSTHPRKKCGLDFLQRIAWVEWQKLMCFVNLGNSRGWMHDEAVKGWKMNRKILISLIQPKKQVFSLNMFDRFWRNHLGQNSPSETKDDSFVQASSCLWLMP